MKTGWRLGLALAWGLTAAACGGADADRGDDEFGVNGVAGGGGYGGGCCDGRGGRGGCGGYGCGGYGGGGYGGGGYGGCGGAGGCGGYGGSGGYGGAAACPGLDAPLFGACANADGSCTEARGDFGGADVGAACAANGGAWSAGTPCPAEMTGSGACVITQGPAVGVIYAPMLDPATFQAGCQAPDVGGCYSP